jgi:hypothetical protein
MSRIQCTQNLSNKIKEGLHRRQHNIKSHLKGMKFEGVDWSHLIRLWSSCGPLWTMKMKLCIQLKVKTLASWVTICFSRTLLHTVKSLSPQLWYFVISHPHCHEDWWWSRVSVWRWIKEILIFASFLHSSSATNSKDKIHYYLWMNKLECLYLYLCVSSL